MSTSGEIFVPNFVESSEAYVRYCSGLAIVQSPFDTIGIHNRPDVAKDAGDILATAEGIMILSMQKLIRVIHPPDAPKNARYYFEENEPLLRQAVVVACETEEARLDELNDWYATLRPAPFLDKSTYSNIEAKRYERLSLPQLMDDFVPHEIFKDLPTYIERPATS